jgi:hypothetical protein
MKRKTFYTSQNIDVDCEYDIDFNDLLQLVESCNKKELEKIRELTDNNSDINTNNLYDENKLRVLKVAFDKYTLEELQKILNIKNNEY